jgi:hypothetical protein
MTSFRYFYLRNRDKQPVVCISYLVNREDGKATYGTATFNPDEERVIYDPVMIGNTVIDRIPVHRKVVFDRTFLRELASGRLVVYKKEAKLPPKQYASFPAIEHAIVSSISKEKGLPKRTKQAAKLWLANAEEKKTVEFTLDAEEALEEQKTA